MLRYSIAPINHHLKMLALKLRKQSPTKQSPTKLFMFTLVAITLLGILVKTAGSILGAVIPVRYTPCPDLVVENTAVNDTQGYFTVRNMGDQVITDFTLSYIGFDSNGNLMKLGYNNDKYKECTYTSVNILPEQVYGIWDKPCSYGLEDGVKYSVATVSSVTYKNGREWTAKGLNKWAKSEEKRFSVDGYARIIEHMRVDALKAETTSEVVISNSQKYNDNSFSNSDDLKVTLRNDGQHAVKDVYIFVLQYDANGYATGDQFGGYCVRNAESIICRDANLLPGNTTTAEWGLFFEPQTKNYNLLVYKVEYTDGTTWKNEYAMQWMLYNENWR